MTAGIVFVLILIAGAVIGVIAGKIPLSGHMGSSEAGSLPATAATSPPQSADVQEAVSPGVPTSIVIRRGQTTLIRSGIDGVYTPLGTTVDPPGNNPVWIGTSSQVGTDMQTAVIAGHAEYGHAEMPFTNLGLAQPGDMIDVTVPAGIVTFMIDQTSTPDRTQMGFSPEDNTLKVISCAVRSSGQITQNVLLSAHLVSSKAGP